ncbi:MAG: LacI family DNA-binding transcriptional regulator, partial [Bryobacteraceae bacterium]
AGERGKLCIYHVKRRNVKKYFMNHKKTRPTIKHVAELSGVSVASVSRVMTGSAPVDASVEERVREAAQALKFDLARRRPRTMALLLGNRAILHDYHSHILTGAEAYCSTHDYTMLFLPLRYEAEAPWNKLAVPKALQRHDLVSGFILAGTNYPNLLRWITERRIPYAVLGDNMVGEWDAKACDVVWSDDVQGAFEMTQYLQSLGHRDIWYVGSRRLPWFQRRFTGYAKAMTEARLEPRASEFDVTAVDEMGYLGTKAILGSNHPVTAIFAAGDLVAEGVYRALRDRGVRVPDEFSVAGFNDIEAPVMHPPLTTVRQFPEQVGRHLAEMVVNRIRRPDLPPQQATIPTQLIKRESCRGLSVPRVIRKFSQKP